MTDKIRDGGPPFREPSSSVDVWLQTIGQPRRDGVTLAPRPMNAPAMDPRFARPDWQAAPAVTAIASVLPEPSVSTERAGSTAAAPAPQPLDKIAGAAVPPAPVAADTPIAKLRGAGISTGTVAFARGQIKRPPSEPPPNPEDLPLWKRPFIAVPGVRYMRTPDHLLPLVRQVDVPVLPIVPEFEEDVPARSDTEPTLRVAEPTPIEIEDPQEVEPLHIENEAAFGPHRGLPRRLKMTRGVAVDIPPPANDPETQLVEVPATAPKQPFAVAVRPKAKAEDSKAAGRSKAKKIAAVGWVFPSVELLGEARKAEGQALTAETLEQNARLLESTLEDFGIRGEIIHVRAGPVVTLYELEPAPGMKSSRVIGLADDIARSMSALSARVAVVPGRNAIGIELPNERRETVYFREMIETEAFSASSAKLAIALGKTIGGEPVIAELAKMPHLLVAGTTGSGKSVAINTMILSLLYRLKPEECRLIMVDPKMLELSVYDGIPHLLTPVVTDPKKAVVALKWAVREMEDRYKKMAKLGVRNIDGFNARVSEAKAAGETIMTQVTSGFDKETGKPIIEEVALDLATLPYIVIIVDEMADLMMVAGKDIEGAIQRLAQMARAAGIHLIMATQRPSVDVITGTIKANFPTRISFQVTSKIDSRTILGEQGAEQLLGQGDMLHMQGGGRIYRVHGPFVSDADVERVVAHLKSQRAPDYLDSVTDDVEGDEATVAEDDEAVFDKTAMGGEEEGDLYEQAVKIVMRDKKTSVSYVQRRLQVGYNKAASLVERMEKEGILSPASHSGKREILAPSRARVISGLPEEA